MIGLWTLAPTMKRVPGRPRALREAISCVIVDDARRKRTKWTSCFRRPSSRSKNCHGRGGFKRLIASGRQAQAVDVCPIDPRTSPPELRTASSTATSAPSGRGRAASRPSSPPPKAGSRDPCGSEKPEACTYLGTDCREIVARRNAPRWIRMMQDCGVKHPAVGHAATQPA